MFWDIFVALCSKHNTTPTAVVNKLGLAKGNVTSWKKGKVPQAVTQKKIADYFGVSVDYSEVFISDGAKSDCGNIGDIFSKDNIVLVPDPVYPVYVDANIMSGRKIIYASSSKDNHFLAMFFDNLMYLISLPSKERCTSLMRVSFHIHLRILVYG